MDATGNKKRSLLKLLIFTAYLCCLFLIGVFAYRRPHYNWDMLAYMALVIKADHQEMTPAQIHQTTYATAKENIPATDYEHLTGGENRRLLSQNPDAFFKTLPFYAVKPFYIKMVWVFYKTGWPLPVSTVLPSILFYFLIGLLLFLWLLKYLNMVWVFATSVTIMCSAFMVFMPRLSTPDCMSAFFLLLAYYFILVKPSLQWVFVFLMVSVFTRLDNIIPCFFISTFLFFNNKWGKRIPIQNYLLMLLAFIICYFGITITTINVFGWSALYYPNYIQYMNLDHNLQAGFSLKEYLALVFSHLTTAIVFYNFVFFLLFFILLFYFPAVGFKKTGFDQSFAVLLLMIILVRFVLYPDLSDRFNIASYLCFIILFIKKYAAQVFVPI